MLHVYVDADACPVKTEVYKVAERFAAQVTLVANAHLGHPTRAWLRLEVVDDAADAADDWIARHAGPGDVVITTDVPLAARCIAKDAAVIAPNGRVFTEKDIGHVLATRDLLTELRSAGETTSGPPPLQPRDRSRFVQELDRVLRAIWRRQGEGRR